MATKDEKNNFSIEIEKIVKSKKLSYLEAITEYCSETGLEIEMAATLLNDVLKSKIKLEAEELRYLPKTSTLPI